MSTSGGTRPRYWCKWACSIERTCRWRGSSRLESCYALHKNTKTAQTSHEKEISMATDENKQIVKDLFAAFGSGDIAVLRDLFAEDVIWHLPGKVPHYSGTYKGPDRVADFFQGLFANVGVELFQPREFVAEADRVLVLGSSRRA